MKNSAYMKYLLVGLVALIWGLILYKVIRGLSDDDPPPVTTKVKSPPATDTLSTYSLITAAYPDPFSNELIVEEEVVEETLPDGTPAGKVTNPQAAPIAALPPPAPPPAIKYSGYIYNPQTRKKTAMITVNGRTMTVGVHDKIDGQTKVVKISDEKITVSFDGKKIDFAIGG